jgi:hypothetical protein
LVEGEVNFTCPRASVTPVAAPDTTPLHWAETLAPGTAAPEPFTTLMVPVDVALPFFSALRVMLMLETFMGASTVGLVTVIVELEVALRPSLSVTRS